MLAGPGLAQGCAARRVATGGAVEATSALGDDGRGGVRAGARVAGGDGDYVACGARGRGEKNQGGPSGVARLLANGGAWGPAMGSTRRRAAHCVHAQSASTASQCRGHHSQWMLRWVLAGASVSNALCNEPSVRVCQGRGLVCIIFKWSIQKLFLLASVCVVPKKWGDETS